MYFPIFIDLSEKKILVVGAGKIALRRLHTLGSFAGDVLICAPEFLPDTAQLAAEHPDVFRILVRRFEESDLDGMDLVLAATDDHALNRWIASLCRERKIPVNVCSEKEECDFYFPSVVCREGMVIGINASGKDHKLVKRTRERLEEFL